MEKIIAIPTDGSGILDAHFGHSNFFEIIKTNDENIVSTSVVVPPPHEPGLLPKWLSEQGVTDIIAGGMGQKAITILNKHGVNAFVGAPQLASKELAEKFLKGSLNLSENYCDH